MTKIKKWLFAAAWLFCCAGMAKQPPLVFLTTGVPGDSVSLLELPAVLRHFSVRDFALSPGKDELFFTVESNKNTFSSIVRMVQENGKWKTDLAPFSGKYSDLEPAFSFDGQRLYFVSNRPLQDTGKIKDFDIWFAEKQEGGWSAPVNIGAPVNTDANEFYPSVALDGSIYFTAAYKDAKGKEDIYKSTWLNGQYSQPESLPEGVNSAFYEFNAYVAPDESYILFTSYGRADDTGGGDLYISRKDVSGNWQPARNLGEKINSKWLDYCPFVSFDKSFLVFTSERSGIKKKQDKQLSFDGFLKEIGQVQNGKGNLYRIAATEILK